MNVSADACDPHGTQAAASPANPGLASRAADTLRDQSASPGAAPLAPRRKPGGEEPDMALEPDLPSDGRDAVGEAMIRDLPQRPELSEPPSQPHPSSQATWKQFMATNPNAPPPEPVQPLSTPPEPGEIQPTPMPMISPAGMT